MKQKIVSSPKLGYEDEEIAELLHQVVDNEKQVKTAKKENLTELKQSVINGWEELLFICERKLQIHKAVFA